METPKPYCPCDGHTLKPNFYLNDSAPAARFALGKATQGLLLLVLLVLLLPLLLLPLASQYIERFGVCLMWHTRLAIGF